jgi:hypothetical protein
MEKTLTLKRECQACREAAIMKNLDDYVRYAEECLALTKLAGDRSTRVVLREMAAEWIKLADLMSSTQQGANQRAAGPPN